MAKRLLSTHKRVVLSVIIMIVLGILVYMSPLRGNTVAAVGVFAVLNTVMITLMATVQLEIVSMEQDMDTSLSSLDKQYKHQTPYFVAQAENVSYSASSPRANMLERSICLTGTKTTSSLTYGSLHVDLTE